MVCDWPRAPSTAHSNLGEPSRVWDENVGPKKRLSIKGAEKNGKIYWNGGAEGDRTPDLVIANDALSQLSYGPAPSGSPPASAGAKEAP
jgi:hypothetical protein